jgi:hypothetical protein
MMMPRYLRISLRNKFIRNYHNLVNKNKSQINKIINHLEKSYKNVKMYMTPIYWLKSLRSIIIRKTEKVLLKIFCNIGNSII